MSELAAIKTRLAQLELGGLEAKVFETLQKQAYRTQFSAELVAKWSVEFGLTPVQIALKCLPLAACYARVPVSNFFVGAVAIGQSGNFYFGANQEFAGEAIQHSVHAEQSAISHAWLAGEAGIAHMAVNYTPCGHCRQFMNETNTAAKLQIHLPHSQDNLLHSYLPDSFGPKDLNVSHVLFDAQDHGFQPQGDALQQAAIAAANQAYAPYSHAVSSVALQAGEQIITGRYAENAAFNPSFLPLQCALNFCRLQGIDWSAISRVVMAEKQAVLSHRKMTENLAGSLLGLKTEYLPL